MTKEIELNFITKYGYLSKNYSNLTSTGILKNPWFYVVAAFSFILFMVLSLIILKHKYIKTDRELKKNKNKENKIFTEANLIKLLFIFLGIFIISLIYSGYMYFGVFKPQFKMWYNSLPPDGKKLFEIMD